jgi:hypothetical protein
MRGLKMLVVVMGVMLIVGFAALIVVITGRLSHPPPALAPISSHPFSGAPIVLPAGARIETIGVGPDRLVVDIVLPDGNRQLLLIDPASGRQLGTIPLRTVP